MKFKTFEDAPVWRDAVDLAVMIFDWGGRGAMRGHPGLRDQLERAVLSISNNIAEGFERGTQNEFLTFLYYARGSAGEVRSMLIFLSKADTWSEDRTDIHRFLAIATSVLKQLGGWIEHLKKTARPDPRDQNDETRRHQELKRRQLTFLEEIRRIQERFPDPEKSEPETPEPEGPEE